MKLGLLLLAAILLCSSSVIPINLEFVSHSTPSSSKVHSVQLIQNLFESQKTASTHNRESSSQPGIFVQRTWGGSNLDIGYGIAVDSSGNILVTGVTNSFGSASPSQSALVLLKYAPTGNLLWQRVWSGPGSGNDTGESVATDSSGNVYVTGFTSYSSSRNQSLLVLKFDPSGSLLWQKTWGTGSFLVGNGITVGHSGDLYVTGTIRLSKNGGDDMLLLKLDFLGNIVWQRTLGYYPLGIDDLESSSIGVDSIGNVYLTGIANALGAIVKFDSNGNLLWQRFWRSAHYQTGSGDSGNALGIDPSGSVYVAGHTLDCTCYQGFAIATLLKFNSTGSVVWQGTYPVLESAQAYGVAVDSSGSIYLTGQTFSHATGNLDGYLVKIDPAGEQNYVLLYPGGIGNFFDEGEAIAMDAYGGPVITGLIGESPISNLEQRTFDVLANPVLSAPGYSTLVSRSFPVDTPSVALSAATGIVSTPAGNDSYAGGGDIFLVEASPLYVIGLLTSPSKLTSGLGIVFNGTFYHGGNVGVYVDMVTTATAQLYSNQPGGFGISFSHWQAEGGVSVAAPTDNPTTVTITGPGSLLAAYTYTSPAQPVALDPLLLLLLTILAGVSLGAIALITRTRKRIRGLRPTAVPSTMPSGRY